MEPDNDERIAALNEVVREQGEKIAQLQAALRQTRRLRAKQSDADIRAQATLSTEAKDGRDAMVFLAETDQMTEFLIWQAEHDGMSTATIARLKAAMAARPATDQ